MRKLKYFIACTVDHFIARSDDSYDFFLTEGEQVADLYAAFPKTHPAFFREKLGITSCGSDGTKNLRDTSQL
jgi:hypothetical protein